MNRTWQRGVSRNRCRRFDADELYLLTRVFDVPITYFFLRKFADCQGPVVSAHGRSVVVPGGGHQDCPVMASGCAR